MTSGEQAPADARYQLLPPLSDRQREALRESIRVHGVLEDVEVDADGNILDGHHRAAIAEELGIRYPTRERHFATEREKQEFVLTVNLARRQMSELEWGQAFNRLLELRGVRTGQGARNDKGATSATVAQVAKAVGVTPRTAARRRAYADACARYPQLKSVPQSAAIRLAYRWDEEHAAMFWHKPGSPAGRSSGADRTEVDEDGVPHNVPIDQVAERLRTRTYLYLSHATAEGHATLLTFDPNDVGRNVQPEMKPALVKLMRTTIRFAAELDRWARAVLAAVEPYGDSESEEDDLTRKCPVARTTGHAG